MSKGAGNYVISTGVFNTLDEERSAALSKRPMPPVHVDNSLCIGYPGPLIPLPSLGSQRLALHGRECQLADLGLILTLDKSISKSYISTRWVRVLGVRQ
jgi:hypothetical protein